ncbi:MAG: ROK family transcriptional regulator [Lachnospiraceae bacterium]|nr:ROK family transcriptional regulator [Lachnospiraceae bacterium]
MEAVENKRKKAKAKNLQFLRNTNRAAIIRELVLGNANSRIELSKQLGLSRMAISAMVNELIEQNYIEEDAGVPVTAMPKSSGRNPVMLNVPNKCINAIGIYIKRYEVHCIVADIKGDIFYHDFRVLPVDADNGIFISILYDLLDRAIKKNEAYYLSGIGIASIGPLDIYNKKIFYPPNFYKIGNIDLGQLLEERYQLPVFLDNDMNASAVAEYLYGNNRQYGTLVYVGFSSGVGAGVLMKGQLLHGSAGFAGEIGHISINPVGPLCSCGQHGCVEIYTSTSNLLNASGMESTQELAKLLQRETIPRYVAEAVDDCRNALKTLLITIANLYDPEMIILGEIPQEISSVYITGMEEYMNKHMFHHGFQNIQVKLSELEEKAAYLGAAALVFQKIFSGTTVLPDHGKKENDV